MKIIFARVKFSRKFYLQRELRWRKIHSLSYRSHIHTHKYISTAIRIYTNQFFTPFTRTTALNLNQHSRDLSWWNQFSPCSYSHRRHYSYSFAVAVVQSVFLAKFRERLEANDGHSLTQLSLKMPPNRFHFRVCLNWFGRYRRAYEGAYKRTKTSLAFFLVSAAAVLSSLLASLRWNYYEIDQRCSAASLLTSLSRTELAKNRKNCILSFVIEFNFFEFTLLSCLRTTLWSCDSSSDWMYRLLGDWAPPIAFVSFCGPSSNWIWKSAWSPKR